MASIIKVDTIQTAAGGTPTAADLGLNTTGSVLQVVQETKDSATNTTSSTFASTGLTATITPSSASSKVLVMVSLPMYLESQSNSSSRGNVRVLRGSTDLTGDIQAIGIRAAQGINTYVTHSGMAAIQYLDSPSTTSATTYTLEHKSTRTDSATVVVSFGNNATGTLTLLEIAG